MTANETELVRYAIVVLAMALMVAAAIRRRTNTTTVAPPPIVVPPVVSESSRTVSSDQMRETIEKLTATVNTLASQLDEAYKRIRFLETQEVKMRVSMTELEGKLQKAIKEKTLIFQAEVIVGGDSKIFERDRSALRRAKVRYHRTSNATQASIKLELRRRRQGGSLPKWWIVSAHAGPAGVELLDGIAPPGFWNDVLDGVELVVVAVCEGNNVADEIAGLVDTVIWFQETVDNQDAADFNYALFRRLVAGIDIDQAWIESIDEVPQVADFVDMRHS